MKINILRGILIILLFGTFFLIFGFSNQNATESSGISEKVSESIVNIFNSNESNETKMQLISNIEPIIRKIAHFSIYTVVGILLMALASTYNFDLKSRIYGCLLIGFIYACSDEIHQLFVDGRSGEFRDVLIDTCGVLTGICICLGILKLFYKIIKKSDKYSIIGGANEGRGREKERKERKKEREEGEKREERI